MILFRNYINLIDKAHFVIKIKNKIYKKNLTNLYTNYVLNYLNIRSFNECI